MVYDQSMTMNRFRVTDDHGWRIQCEVTSQPWFGPRSRARELLAHREQLVAPKDGIQMLQQLLGGRLRGVQFVRFVDFYHEKERFRYTLAIIWTFSDPALRQTLYEVGPRLVKLSGWYPLPQGERMYSKANLSTFLDAGSWQHSFPCTVTGRLASVERATKPEGCAIRLRTDTGEGILLDTGFAPPRGDLVVEPSDRLAVLSHVHGDHSLNLRAAGAAGLPVGMTEATAQLLDGLSYVPRDVLQSFAVLIHSGETQSIGPRLTLSAFMVPHMPGAAGFVLTDDETSLVYTGDVCLRTSQFDFTPELHGVFQRAGRPNQWLLLDASMLVRPHGAGTLSVAKQLLHSAESLTDVIVYADSPEHLLYACLDLFKTVQDDPAKRQSYYFLVSAGLRPLFRVVHSAFIGRWHQALDPFVLGQYRATMSAWAESRWLLWLDRYFRMPQDEVRRIWLVSSSDLRLVRPRGPAGIVPSGRAEPPGQLPSGHAMVRLELDSAPWALHTGDTELVSSIRQLTPKVNVVLFHDFEKRLQKGIAANQISAVPLGRNPIPLR